MHHLLHHNPYTVVPGLLPLALGLIVLEIGWRVLVAGIGYDWRESFATLVIAIGHGLTGALAALLLAPLYAWVWSFAPWHLSMRDWRVWVIGFVVVEFAYYWFHRFSHEVRWLWATHAVHHTPQQITLLSSIRLGWTNLISAGWLVYLPVMLVGFDPRMVLILLALDLRFQFFLHTEARVSFGPLEWLLNSPAHHRVHHASNGPYLDRNYGGVLIVFDRLFGTFAAEQKNEPLRYGLTHTVTTRNPFRLATGDWPGLLRDMRGAGSWWRAVRVALGRP